MMAPVTITAPLLFTYSDVLNSPVEQCAAQGIARRPEGGVLILAQFY